MNIMCIIFVSNSLIVDSFYFLICCSLEVKPDVRHKVKGEIKPEIHYQDKYQPYM